MKDIKELIKNLRKKEWKCELCGATNKLVNHHISYVPERILVVCTSCHAKLHYYPEFKEICPDIKRTDWKLLKRILYPAKIKNLDIYKDPDLLIKEGKLPSDEEMKKLVEEKPIL